MHQLKKRTAINVKVRNLNESVTTKIRLVKSLGRTAMKNLANDFNQSFLAKVNQRRMRVVTIRAFLLYFEQVIVQRNIRAGFDRSRFL